MKMARHMLAAILMGAVWLPVGSADGFYISSLKTDPCHERLMLGALGAQPGPFGTPATPADALVDTMARRAQGRGVPTDEPTAAFVRDLADRYGFSNRPLDQRFVLASFVAGVRQPDTNGLSVIKFNETRSIHLQDKNQPMHALRRTGHDGQSGNVDAVTEAREIVHRRVGQAVDSWWSAGHLLDSEPWTFAFYGKVDVAVFVPAYQLGRAAHVIQDSYAHSYRDPQMRIVAVANFVDVVEQQYSESRDGPAHADRLDECDVDNSRFDQMRVSQAAGATAALLKHLRPAFIHEMPSKRVQHLILPVLNRVFEIRSDCTLANDYCDNAWKPIAERGLTKPYKLTLCATDALSGQSDGVGKLDAWFVAVCAAGLAVGRWVKSRGRRSTV